MTIDGEDYITVAEAATEARVSQQAIRNAIYEGSLSSERILGRLMIRATVFQSYLKDRRPVGRPPKTKTEQENSGCSE